MLPVVGAAIVLLVPVWAAAAYAACGDGVLDADEQCDAGDANGTVGACCTSLCELAPAGTPCRPAANVCDVAELCTGDNDACPDDVVAPDGLACDDGNPCTTGDSCVAGACVGAGPICGNGVLERCEPCDDGAANGSPASCCTSTCAPKPYGAVCGDDGDLCTSDTCDGSGGCQHLVEPSLGCFTPTANGASALKITRRPSNGTTRISFKWARGNAIDDARIGDLASARSRLCIYDQTGPDYRLVYQGSPSSADGAWASTSTGWRFRGASGGDEGISDVSIGRSLTPGRSKMAVKARGALALAPLPMSRRRRVAVQFHTDAGACWGASFSDGRRNDATRYSARSEDTVLPDANGNGVRELMVIGDSNTKFLSCSYPQQLSASHPALVVWNEAIFGSATVGWVAQGLLPPLLDEHQPDAVVIALGVNDSTLLRTSDQIVADLVTLGDQVDALTFANGGHALAYFATIPLIYPEDDPRDPVIAAVNARLRALEPAGRIVDFDSWMPDVWEAGVMWRVNDGVHIGCAGHTRRAEVLEPLTGQ